MKRAFILFLIFLLSITLVYKNRYRLIDWLYSFETHRTFDSELHHSSKYVFGLDVSKYQGKIDWNLVKESHHPIEFVFIRSTMGDDRKDYRFMDNWKKAKKVGLIRGAYHYYDPNENSTKQAKNFISSVKIEKGDLPPVLDIESHSKFGNNNLKKGLKNWIKIIEKHYNIKPIIYTTKSHYYSLIKEDFKNYPIWIASYTSKRKIKNIHWEFHQFSDKVRVKGIREMVDGNDFNGTIKDLNKLTMK